MRVEGERGKQREQKDNKKTKRSGRVSTKRVGKREGVGRDSTTTTSMTENIHFMTTRTDRCNWNETKESNNFHQYLVENI